MPFSEEQKKIRRARAAAWNKANPDRARRNSRLAYQRNIAAIRAGTKKPTKQNPEVARLRCVEWRKVHPWYNIWQGIKQRCGNPKHPRYYRYGGRGIRCLLSKGDMQYLWTRDNAGQMVDPSIDRINNNGDYCVDNCQIITRHHNTLKGSQERTAELYDRLLSVPGYQKHLEN